MIPCPSRLLPSRALPPYSYVSGKFPHPLQDAAGHSFGTVEPKASIDREKDWRTCVPYLWGIDLFNNGYYWEAHETWEAVWHATGRSGTMVDFCKALIKLAAAGVKAREGRANGVRRHAQRAKQLLESVAAQVGREQQRFMGLSLASLTHCAEGLISDPSAIVDTGDAPVVVVMPFALQVEAD
jgi:predicted metal-dependent hydrolase